MLLNMVHLEVEAWSDDLCIDFCAALDWHTENTDDARAHIEGWSRYCISQRYQSLANSFDARIFQLRPDFVLSALVMRRLGS